MGTASASSTTSDPEVVSAATGSAVTAGTPSSAVVFCLDLDFFFLFLEAEGSSPERSKSKAFTVLAILMFGP
jgi:hypothetical protein